MGLAPFRGTEEREIPQERLLEDTARRPPSTSQEVDPYQT